MTDYNVTRRVDLVLSTQGDGTGTIEQNVAGKTVSGATNATPIVLTATSHGYSDGDFVTITGVGGCTAANGLHVVANKAANTFELNTSDGADVAGNGAYTSGGDSHLAYVCKPASTEVYELWRLNGVAGDGAAVAVEQYIGIAKLTNGIAIEVRNAAGLIHTLTATPVKAWNDWSLNAGVDTPLLDLTGNNTDSIFRWTFVNSGIVVRLNGSAGEFLVVRISDDLDGLTYQRMAVQGLKT